MIKSIYFSIIIIFLLGCQQTNKSLPYDYRETPKPIETEFCDSAEQHLLLLCREDPQKNSYCCQVVSPTKKGKAFKQFCEETQDAGIALNPKCLSKINDCGLIDKCVGTVK